MEKKIEKDGGRVSLGGLGTRGCSLRGIIRLYFSRSPHLDYLDYRHVRRQPSFPLPSVSSAPSPGTRRPNKTSITRRKEGTSSARYRPGHTRRPSSLLQAICRLNELLTILPSPPSPFPSDIPRSPLLLKHVTS